MNGIELGNLIRETARESAQRDAEILREVSEVKTVVAVHEQRLDVAEQRLSKASDRWAEDTGRFQRAELARVEKKASELGEAKRHWVRWVVGGVGGALLAAIGAGLLKFFGG